MTGAPVSQAFQLAANRWFAATGEATRLQAGEGILRFATIGEVLFWGVALDDTLQHSHGQDDLCLGLRFARNRATHDLLETVRGRPGAVLPARLPFRLQHFVWREARALPTPAAGPGSGSGGRLQRAAYERAWQGQHVDSTVLALGRHFGVSLAR